MDSLLPRHPFVLPITVGDDDIDAQQHASNVAVVRWMSRAAMRHSIALGFGAARYEQLGAMFVVRRHEIDYLDRARLGEELVCYTWPSAIAKVTAKRRHCIIRPADDAVIAKGLNVWAYLDMATGRPRRMPAEVRAAFDPARFL